jgi:hypothetical protein
LTFEEEDLGILREGVALSQIKKVERAFAVAFNDDILIRIQFHVEHVSLCLISRYIVGISE